jgi:glycosyltransferase involved in cell wall biosynthesis
VVAGNIPNMDDALWTPRIKEAGEMACLFVSRIHPKKNLHFVLSFLREMKTDCKVRLDIYGTADDVEYVGECKRMAMELSDKLTVTFKGALPHDQVFSTLHRYHLFVLPTLGENFGHAIFEALSAGCPVLISDQTPWNDLHLHNAGWSIPLSDKRLFVQKAEEVMAMDADAFNNMSLSARNYAIAYSKSQHFQRNYFELFR